ncbi:MAG: hypothetical protein V7L04_19085 [Nostoc sp.]|uniref:hypothetical protein n=1 Tax=Nostoc sp. TaxID=1180 RepID=UPI002FFCFEE7
MAKNTGYGYRRGAVNKRSQTYNPKIQQWVKRNAETGLFMNVKQDGKPFKGVTQEH